MRMSLLFLLLLGLANASGQTVRKVKITDLEDLIRQSDHPLIVNFWATFCVPCNKEIPYFESTVGHYRDEGVQLILVSLDLPAYYPARITSFAKNRGYASPIVWLDETNADYFCPKIDPSWSGGIPCSLFINNKTHYRRFFDRQLTDRQVDAEIKKMVAR
jgi:thiol-disulfide isomerase/thioredoxin